MIRIAQLKDAAQICNLVTYISSGTMPDAPVIKRKFDYIINNPDYFVYVWDDMDHILGTATLYLHHTFGHNCGIAGHLENLAVLPEFRGMSIGRSLVNTVKHKAIVCGCYKLSLNCFDHNVGYYEKLGFFKHDNGMRINLSQSATA